MLNAKQWGTTRKRGAVLLAAVVVAGLGTGTAIAAVGVEWRGTISSTGGKQIVAVGGVDGFPNVYAYSKRSLALVLTPSTAGAPTYTVRTTGTMVNDGDFVTASGQTTWNIFDFKGSATLLDDHGAILCTGGSLSFGGSLQGHSMGQFSFSPSCTVFTGSQFFGTWFNFSGGSSTWIVEARLIQR